MNLLSAVASGGIWPALPWTGYWLWWRRWRADERSRLPGLTRLALMTVAGIAVWSVGLLGTAMAGVYHPEWWGAAGWVVTLASLIEWRKTATAGFGRGSWRGATWSAWDGALAVGLILAAVLYLGYPTDTIANGTDEGIYANHAIYLARHGRLDFLYPWPDDLDPAFKAAFKSQVNLPGLSNTEPTLTVQFAHLFPVWLAQAYATLGPHGLFRVNAVFALLSLGVFYGLCHTLLPRPATVAATLFLALNPSQLWMARITLSEVFTQLWIWSGLLLLYQALRQEDRFLAGWAGVFLGTASLVRCDCWLLPALLFLSHFLFRLVKEPAADRSGPVWAALYQTALPLTALAVGHLWFFSRVYFLYLVNYFLIFGWFTGLCLQALLEAVPGIRNLARPWLQARGTVVLFGLGLAGVAVYAYWVRPYLFPRQIPSYALSNLARYLSPLVIWGAVGGVALALRRAWRPQGELPLLPLLVVGVAYAGGYLVRPSVEIYHFWAVRRFVPVVIPAFVCFAALGVSWLLGRWPRRWQVAAAAGVLTFLGFFTVQASGLIWHFAENHGAYAHFQAMAEHLPREDLTVAFAMPPKHLHPFPFAFGRPVVILDAGREGAAALLERWLATRLAEGRPVYLLGENYRFPGRHHQELHRETCELSFTERVWRPLPQKIVTQCWTYYLYQITEPPRPTDYLDMPLGNEKVWGIEESGFGDSGQGFPQPVRWTQGEGRLVVPLDRHALPKALRVNVQGGPLGTNLRVLANGTELFQGTIRPEDWSQTFELAGVRLDEKLTIELVSEAAVPQGGSKDEEPVGVMVKEIRLLGGNQRKAIRPATEREPQD
jgi:hypothetical protein